MNLNPDLLNFAWYAVGFGYSLLFGLLIGRTHDYIYLKFHKEKSIGWRSSITGIVERGLYTGAMLGGHLEFVGVWLVLKSVAHWDRFKADFIKVQGIRDATAKFNGYFVCTGMSIAYGLTGAYVTKLLIDCHYIPASLAGFALVVAHIILNIYIKAMAMREMKDG
jgi:hypothetical protein